MNAIKVNENPARLYLDGIAAGSRWSMKQALESAARLLSGDEHGADTCPWWEVRYQHTADVRRHWAGQFKPATVNKLLAGLRGVLKQTWRLGLVAPTPTAGRSTSKTSPARPFPEVDRLRALSSARFLSDWAPRCRHAGGALRHRHEAAELAGLDVAALDLADKSILVRNGKLGAQPSPA